LRVFEDEVKIGFFPLRGGEIEL